MLPQTLARRGDARAQADYLMHFRADSIVRDAEIIRRQLVGEREPWSVLGQSYGGFCAVHYLSAHPHGLREVFITGGLPPLAGSADDYYRHTYPEVQRKTRKFFARYPADRELCARIMEHLHKREVTLPTGGRLTVRRFQQVGFMLGFDDGNENLHYLLETRVLRRRGRRRAEPSVPARAREFAAVRDQSDLRRAARDVLHAGRRLALVGGARARRVSRHGVGAGPAAVVHRRDDLPVDVRGLRRTAAAARGRRSPRRGGALARAVRRRELARNTVPVRRRDLRGGHVRAAGAVGATAASIGRMKAWLTNEYEHNGLRASDAVFERLLALQRGEGLANFRPDGDHGLSAFDP